MNCLCLTSQTRKFEVFQNVKVSTRENNYALELYFGRQWLPSANKSPYNKMMMMSIFKSIWLLMCVCILYMIFKKKTNGSKICWIQFNKIESCFWIFKLNVCKRGLVLSVLVVLAATVSSVNRSSVLLSQHHYPAIDTCVPDTPGLRLECKLGGLLSLRSYFLW